MNIALKTAAGILMAVTSVSARAGEESPTDVENKVDVKSLSISNVIGLQKLVSEKEYTPIAVCFGATAVSTNRAINVVRPATNLVFTANLEAGDQLFVYDHARAGYVAYVLNESKLWEPSTVYGTEPGHDLSPLDGQSQSWGYGFWLRRQNLSGRADKAIYIAGQVPVDVVSVTLPPSTKDAFSKTLIGNVLGTEWDLDDKTIVDWSAVAQVNDHIVLDNADATSYYWMKLSKSPETYGWKRVKGTGTGNKIPAGAAFWYVRAKPKTGTTQQPIVISYRTGL